MAESSGGVNRLPTLGGILLAVLALSLVLALARPGLLGGDSSATTDAEALAEAQAAYRLSAGAMRGEPTAFSSLAVTNQRLAAADLDVLDEAQARGLAQLRDGARAIEAGRTELVALRAAADRLDTLVPQLAEQIYALQGTGTVRTQPAAVAQLERLRVLTASLRQDLRAISLGTSSAGGVNRSILDAEMAMTQIVRGLREGDVELGLNPVRGSDVGGLLEALREQTAAIASTVRDVLAQADRLSALRQAMDQVEKAATELPAIAVDTPTLGARVADIGLALLLGAGIVVALAMLLIHRRQADTRRAAAAQAAQNERNQQAILTLLDEMSSLADGDLTVHATVTEDITGAIADSINYAVEALRELVATISESAIMVDGAAKQTEGNARQLAAGSEAQSKQIEAASRAIGRMAASIEEVAGNAERSSDVARHSVDVAHKGGDAVRRTIEGMNAIRETIQETSKRIKRLGESSQEIGNIVELINDIADQTNILALNAAIQASMAGEAGRGFAVVADEVQRLAERSANATRQIELLVRTIQTDTNEAIVSMDRSTTDVVGGALLAENAGAALEEIEQVSNQIASLVQNISSSAREQGKAAAAVTRSMDVLQEISSETSATTSATTSAISKLAELATQLRRSIAGFRLPGGPSRPTGGMDASGTHEIPATVGGSQAAEDTGEMRRFSETLPLASKRSA